MLCVISQIRQLKSAKKGLSVVETCFQDSEREKSKVASKASPALFRKTGSASARLSSGEAPAALLLEGVLNPIN